jgi:hypothetical protein
LRQSQSPVPQPPRALTPIALVTLRAPFVPALRRSSPRLWRTTATRASVRSSLAAPTAGASREKGGRQRHAGDTLSGLCTS